ncbi:MAG: hypothetical protein JXA71_08545, partial [Chitinispirillaceae bacterium]|nr:hypothetical protein [Chitinispirillaceae bacterium]
LGNPDNGVGVHAAKMNGRSFTHTTRSLRTHGGIVRLALPVKATYGRVEIIASNGKVVAAYGAISRGTIEIRLPARGVYLICGKSAGSRTLIARVLRL